MSAGAIVEVAAACIWLGTYLFSNFVVSPGLSKAVPDPAQRTAIRSVIGRRYGALAGPLLALWLVAVLLQPMSAWTVTRAVLLGFLLIAVGWHGYLLGGRMQALAKAELEAGAEVSNGPESGEVMVARREGLRRASARLTVVSLVLSVALAAAR